MCGWVCVLGGGVGCAVGGLDWCVDGCVCWVEGLGVWLGV